MEFIGRKINNRYKIIEKIAEGVMSNLYAAEQLENDRETVAIKILKGTATTNRIEDIIRFRFEANAISRINHPNIVRIDEIGEVIKLHYIVMELIDGKSLAETMKNETIGLDYSIEIISQICLALDEVHRQGGIVSF